MKSLAGEPLLLHNSAMEKKRSTYSHSNRFAAQGAYGSTAGGSRSRAASSSSRGDNHSYARSSRRSGYSSHSASHGAYSSVRRPVGDYDFDYGEYGYGDSGRRGSGSRRPSHGRPSSRGPKKRKGSKLKVVLIVLVLALVCAGAGAFAYVAALEGNLHIGLGSNMDEVLVDSDITNEPFYMLLLGTDGSAERDETGDFGGTYRSDSIILARIDPVEDKATLVSLHRDTLLDMGEYGNQKLNAAYALGGPSYMVETVSKLAGVPISHYAEVNFDGFKDIVDALGGVEVDVPMEIDDDDAGGYVGAGLQTLTGDQALILCRARHAYDEYGDGDSFRAANQRLVLSAIAKKVLSTDIVTMTSTVQAMSEHITTDLTLTEIVALAQALNGMDVTTDLYTAMEPTTSTYIEGDGWYEINNVKAWQAMMKRVDQGLPPTSETEIDEASGTVLATVGDGSVDPAANDGSGEAANEGFEPGGTVIVRNGSGEAGVASEAADKLTPEGYDVETGDADDFGYSETLIVYSENSKGAEAKAIARTLGIGTVQLNDGNYDFDGDFLVIVGSDWE